MQWRCGTCDRIIEQMLFFINWKLLVCLLRAEDSQFWWSAQSSYGCLLLQGQSLNMKLCVNLNSVYGISNHQLQLYSRSFIQLKEAGSYGEPQPMGMADQQAFQFCMFLRREC